MKRLFFTQSTDKLTYFCEILCEKDVLKGIVSLNVNSIDWLVFNSNDDIIDSGVASSTEAAKKKIKSVLINNGAKFDKEYRKYKI